MNDDDDDDDEDDGIIIFNLIIDYCHGYPDYNSGLQG